MPFSWKQWSDDLAGIERYGYEVFHLQPHGNVLREADIFFSSFRTPDSKLESILNVTTPGMYSILLTAFDKAGNYKSTRSVFLFDNQSFVETTSGTRTTVLESTVESNYTWVVFDTSLLNVTWAGRFMNERHDVYKWLNEIDANKHVDHEYDDMSGRRTVQWFPNVKGIVKFDINYTVTGAAIESSKGYTEVLETLKEAAVLNVTWKDGHKLDISVKATDLIGEYTEDKITIYKDTSQPVIENLWLSYGNKTELFVHPLQDLTSMTFEWDTFDYHSGIYSVHWKLFDNYTWSDIIHGSSHLQAQGDASNITSCENMYQNSPRGSDCYCTFHHGCFHRHFHVQPEIVNGSGLTPGKDKGLHDSDYFIEITVVNKAMLMSVLTKKITIDTSRPQSGSVHDGLPGSPEIDFQQDLYLNFHWYGFFDPESGIKYYKYIVANYCWTRQDLISSNEGRETHDTTTSYNATKEGIYHITVIAMNSANDPSDAVCTDGVTITTEKPNVKNVLIQGLKTTPRIVIDSSNTMWIIGQNLTRTLLNDTTLINTTNIIPVEDIKLFPKVEKTVSDIDIPQASAINSLFVFVLPRIEQLSMTWDSSMEEYVYDYYIGLSSTNENPAPDLLPFRSTKHHTHFRLNHPDITEGTIFYTIIKSVSKANVEGMQSYGPIIIDATPPMFTGSRIDLKFEDSTLIANWSRTAFRDFEDPYPLHYQFALGHAAGKTDVFGYQPLLYSKTCVKTQPPECTAIDTSSLDWSLHGHHDYYVTIKATNLAGFSSTQTSVVYTHDTQLPSPGLVYDIDPISMNSRALQDLIDIDFAVQSNSLAVEWKGFYHPHLQIHYIVCIGMVKGSCDIAMKDNLNWTSNQYTFSNLLLSNFQTYFSTVEAVATTGSVKVSTDGVTVINNRTELAGVIVNDGPICSVFSTASQAFSCEFQLHLFSDKIVLNRSHHFQDVILSCKVDISYQISTTTLQAKWKYSNNLTEVINNVYWSIDRRSPVGDAWFQLRDFSYIGSQKHIAVSGLDLQPGMTYRFSMKFCAHSICFPTISSDGVTVVPSNPVTGSIEVHLEDQKMIVIFAMMYDPDIEDRTESIDAIGSYEWTITGNVVDGKQFEKWGLVEQIQAINNTHFKTEIPLSSEIDFAKCKHVTIRGTNKVGVWSVISAEIKQCQVEDGHRQIVPRKVIDAIGDGEIDAGIGNNINLETNAAWTLLDADYTPYKNVLSALWPSLRHKSYQWGVVQVKNIDAQTFYTEFTDIVISDPCSHPDSIQCGQTGDSYINVEFNDTNYLIHGRRYSICIHAPETVIEHEKWTETLDTVTSCSDGVTVDLTPPVPGRVWVGDNPLVAYQTSSSDLYVAWDSFIDVEEQDHSMHSSGIRQYSISIGSIEGGNDIIDQRNVGLTNHMSFHSLQLQNGHKYFVTLRGFDIIGRYSEIQANPITIDTTPPEWTGESITISGRLLSNLSEIEACWENVFMDSQSGIDHFMWGVGSLVDIDDVIPFSMTFQQCAMSVEADSYVLSEGQPYFITIKAFNRAKLSTTRSSWAYIYDISPPTAGHVYDGRNDNIISSTKDIDFQTNMTHLFLHWEGFHDPHSVIKYYSVQIGTCSGCNDVMEQQTVGVHTVRIFIEKRSVRYQKRQTMFIEEDKPTTTMLIYSFKDKPTTTMLIYPFKDKPTTTMLIYPFKDKQTTTMLMYRFKDKQTTTMLMYRFKDKQKTTMLICPLKDKQTTTMLIYPFKDKQTTTMLIYPFKNKQTTTMLIYPFKDKQTTTMLIYPFKDKQTTTMLP
ncbi:unnamed protein product [Mytilus coruscus]|uniref:Uncharacterized protein n=1 Tax=Mytilus coruscus TaxID=42192 RepID=A0A6J8AWP0_MYTCO|nr:unnamed protein product [Mytilus coruscus]